MFRSGREVAEKEILPNPNSSRLKNTKINLIRQWLLRWNLVTFPW